MVGERRRSATADSEAQQTATYLSIITYNHPTSHLRPRTDPKTPARGHHTHTRTPTAQTHLSDDPVELVLKCPPHLPRHGLKETKQNGRKTLFLFRRATHRLVQRARKPLPGLVETPQRTPALRLENRSIVANELDHFLLVRVIVGRAWDFPFELGYVVPAHRFDSLEIDGHAVRFPR